MYKALYLSPMIPSFNIGETAGFFTDVLGFTTLMDEASYVICEKDNLTIHILRAGQDIGQMEFYLEVDNLDGIWKALQDKAKELNVRAPFVREYGMREIHVEIPKTKTLLFIGQEIK